MPNIVIYVAHVFKGSESDPECTFFTLNTYQALLLLVAFCDLIAGIGPSFRTHGQTEPRTDGCTDGQTDVEVEIVI